MTESEVIKELHSIRPRGGIIPQKRAEALDVAIQALEKQMSKRPYHISQVDDNDNANVECPMCHATTDYAVNVIKRGYCWKCGQLMDWGSFFDNQEVIRK
jgi:hypothetical protein|nr:MAG TPA: TFIIB zinc-binding [Bacteriophage sp.]